MDQSSSIVTRNLQKQVVKKSDRFHHSKQKAKREKEKQQKQEEQKAENELRRKRLLKKRKEKSRNLKKRTAKGQPLMKYSLANILDKLQQQTD